MAASGSYDFSPPISDLFIEAMERIGVFGPALETRHILSARRSANLIQQKWLNRGLSLFLVDQVAIPLTPGQFRYTLSLETINILDSYIRTYTPSSTTQNLGTALTAVVDQNGAPIIGTPYGDPIVQQPGLGVLTCTAGSQAVTFNWPSHGLSVGDPIFWGCAICIGGASVSGFSIVSEVPDSNNIVFDLPTAALETQTGGGGTPLFATTSGSGTVTCVLPGHGLSIGSSFTVPIATAVGGLTLSGTYAVVTAPNSYSFTFAAVGTASSTAVAFENGGQLNVATQTAGTDPTDILLWPISRNDYAALPNKSSSGRPTSFWFDRIVPPVVNFWPVPPTGIYYGFVAYRMRRIQDANPSGGQTLDMPERFIPAFCSELTASLAEKFKPSMYAEKRAIAKEDWDEAASEDVEHVSTYIVPAMDSYFR